MKSDGITRKPITSSNRLPREEGGATTKDIHGGSKDPHVTGARDSELRAPEDNTVLAKRTLQVIGGLPREERVGAGASQIAQNLQVLDRGSDKSKVTAGVTGMLVALMLTFSHVAPSHAQDTSQITAPHNATLFLPQKTGPPSFTTTASTHSGYTLPDLGGIDQRSTVFGAQMHALKKQEAGSVDAVVQRALDQFTAAMTHTLRMDAYGAALGGPLDPARGLTDAEQSAVKKALTNLLREMPIGALAPEMTDALGELMRGRGMSTAGLESKRLRDLGDIGGDAVKQMVENLKDEKPAVFYGLAAGLATAVGAVAYTQGTDAIGIKPEFKTKFFNDQFIAKVRAEWGPKFADPKITTRLEHHGTLNIGDTPFSTTLGVGVVAQGKTFKDLEATGLELSGSMYGVLNNGGQLAISGHAIGSAGNGLEQVTLSGAYLNAPWTAGASVSYFAQEERTVGQLSVGYKPQKNVEWALVGTMDSKGEKYVGVGLKVGF
jgi:hypothetical protein